MFKKILIANRGEIALRIVRACREMGISTVAVHSACDAHSLHVRLADEAVCIGPAQAKDSYLHIPAIISAAEITGADAIHPGYGFLAENKEFAEVVAAHSMTFIGPSPEHLSMFGDKLSAKEAARDAGLPLLGGSTGAIDDAEEAVNVAKEIGFPVMLKAAAGGGGKGMRIIRNTEELVRVFPLAVAESLAAFGSGLVFLERFLERPRHIEVQVAGDAEGNAVHVLERDCSMQRRQQKIIEEATASSLDSDLRDRICVAARDLVASTGYTTVGTVEFLVEEGEFFFLEVNPRIQVEHPVTEEVTGIDLVQLQIRLAAGERMPFSQEEIRAHGHAIEIRVNAEDPVTFLPSPGLITGYHEPGGPGIRIDSAAHEQAMVQPYYDSLVAKLIVWAPTREQCIRRTISAIDEFVVEGIKTTLPLQRELLSDEAFREGRFHTRYVNEYLEARDAN